MIRLIFFASIWMLAAPASAKDCYEALTSDFTKDSQAFQLSEQELGNLDDTGIELATAAVAALGRKLGCDKPLKVDATQSACREIVTGQPASQTCYVHTDLGYFITNVDYLMNTNLIFSRWD